MTVHNYCPSHDTHLFTCPQEQALINITSPPGHVHKLIYLLITASSPPETASNSKAAVLPNPVPQRWRHGPDHQQGSKYLHTHM
ncbi:uncharacterized protein LAJ45_05005 [Morchella importuna]|uniref:uncharacterized protein n=1 Tax=Morchella importuna TaxID=1174673 RepID=UPI001E8DA06C|nr:uncharacterized protein LAJ45_05005 [Morchella importuna]KAH8150824.1 hypothetical protein LAJ45_05005 [Morchella importuna]